MILPALLIVTALGQAAPVTVELRAEPVSRLLADLSPKLGLKLQASPTVANEVVMVKVKNVDRDVLMAKLAAVVSGEWRQDGDIQILAASVSARNREQQESDQRRIANLNTEIQKRTADALKADAGAAPDTPTFSADTDASGTILKLLRGIDTRPIALIGEGQRIVYSTSPTAMQRPLGRDASAVIAKLISTHNAEIGSNEPTSPEVQEQLSHLPEGMRRAIEMRAKRIENPQKALLAITSESFGIVSMTMIQLSIYDDKGNVALTENTSLNSNTGKLEAALKPPVLSPTAKPIQYSPDSKLLMTALSALSNAGGKVDPKALELLATPDKVDPLSFMATDGLFSLADSKGKQLVADLPDSLMSSVNMYMGGEPTVDDVENALNSGDDMVLAETDSWLVAKPAHPADSRMDRTDRKGLATLVKAAQSEGVPSLDDMAAFAQTSPSPLVNGVGQVYASLLVPGMMPVGLSGLTDWNALRFFGTLGLTQRQNLLQGSQLPFNSLSGNQQNLWRAITFGAQARIQLGEPKDSDDIGLFETMISALAGGADYRTEPTELMPNGVPSGAYLTLTGRSEPCFGLDSDGGNSVLGAVMGAIGLDELAMLKMFREDPKLAAASGSMPSIDKVRVGQRVNYMMAFHLPQDGRIVSILNDNHMPKDAPAVSISAMSSDLQKQIADRIDKLKKSSLGQLGGAFGGPATLKP